MNLGKHAPLLAAVAAGLALLAAGEARGNGGLECGVGDLQLVLPAAGGSDKPMSSASAQVQIRCKPTPTQANQATPKALSSYPNNMPKGQVTWSSHHGKVSTGPDSGHLGSNSSASVVVESRAFRGH